jgi:hypothetical protein
LPFVGERRVLEILGPNPEYYGAADAARELPMQLASSGFREEGRVVQCKSTTATRRSSMPRVEHVHCRAADEAAGEARIAALVKKAAS